ncbi:glycosyltransferase family 9 protein [Pelagicoccus mobilis]|uniref:Glycosyltransferase family 9 protein n=1 Tax=Pelagicoccus mobilis TaxID=415221 RepID=A0A934RVD4_9BACT|nr:glycosyltransferase family 9 protein [Pelagicoccus mobilis]MBK1877166.1 glycosyltransferase family 9 protein [Pelagicoccus mobilis]
MTSPLDKIVHALRVVESIKRQKPELEITWVVRRVYEPLVASFEFVDQTIVFQRSEALMTFAGLVRDIRREVYDFVLDFEGHARTGAMCFFARAKRKIGLRSAKEGATICYKEVIAAGGGEGSHFVEELRAFGSVFGVEVEVGEVLRFPRGVELPESVSGALSTSWKRVCLFPGRFKKKRAWRGMVDLAKRLVEVRPDVQVLLLGMVPVVVEEELPDRVLDLQERLSWGELCQVVSESDVVVANDNGPAQLAGALGCRNLTLYSFVSPASRGSYPLEREANAILRAPEGDVDRLDPKSVFSAVEKLLAL